ncbi:cytochrome P450 [Macrolepiota fuliginosa MF-IS2]|uniref:Cytochrome P450 n=1 Tax=Macrolepiota fuliginosa MF-IS2 TaxID=1400762 RepID=A0A9P6C7J5_9AGAR|nr:cytochrome P450 [Macrolepiota fuliginosa MF-IS2]
MASPLLIAATLALLFVIHRVVGALRILHSVGYLPGHRTVFGFGSLWFWILPPTKGIKLDRNFVFQEGHEVFERVGWDACSSMSFWPSLRLNISVADAAAIKDFATTRRFPKPLDLYKAINLFGGNIVASDGDLWKKYRKISGPSFSEKNNKLVWEETLRIVDDLFDNVWENKDAVVNHGVDVTLPLALLVIGAAGFGQKVSWEDNTNEKPGNHKLTFREALHVTASELIFNFVLPNWIKSIPHPRLKKIKLATEELRVYMREMIRDRQASEVEDKHDLFSSLIHANKEELEGASLTEEELMGNIFIFLVAGHETTAHTLSFTFALLALYPEVQEKMLKHIRSVIPNGRRPTYEDMTNLTYVMAVYNETLRMFSPVSSVSKMAPEDTSMVVGNCFNDETKRIPIPKGTQITINVPGVQRNPRYWEKPNEFIPERFLGEWNKDALVAFSVGPRACLGRKFNETEGVAALTSIISQYKVELQDEPQFKHETFEERKNRILTTKLVLTLSMRS